VSGHLGMAPIDGARYVVFVAKDLTYDGAASCTHAIMQTGASLNSAELVDLPVAASAHRSLDTPSGVHRSGKHAYLELSNICRGKNRSAHARGLRGDQTCASRP
jgi:hypothetical protein